MGTLLLALKPTALAVLIGLFDLAVGEVLKFSTTRALVWSRRSTFVRKLRYNYDARPRVLLSTKMAVLLVQLLLLTSCIWWELSISAATFPTTHRRSLRCFHTERLNRAIGREGPTVSELDDDRVTEYLQQADCPYSLVSNALYRPDMRRGYPPCLPSLTARHLDITLKLQGSAIGHVANSDAGDPFLAYGLAEDGKIKGEDLGETDALATTSFWSLDLSGLDSKSAFWFGQDERIISNIELPRAVVDDRPDDFSPESSASISCVSNNLKCYRDSAAHALEVKKPVRRSHEQTEIGTFISSHRFLPSALCIFDGGKIRIDVDWVHLEQHIPNLERPGRTGPVPIIIRIRGSTQCVPEVSRESTRLYLDAMGGINIKDAMENVTADSAVLRASNVLGKAAIVSGRRVPFEQTAECSVFSGVQGSSIGVVETYVSLSLIMTVLLIILFSIVVIVREKWRTSDVVDPFDRVHLLRQICRDQQKEHEAFEGNRDEPTPVRTGGVGTFGPSFSWDAMDDMISTPSAVNGVAPSPSVDSTPKRKEPESFVILLQRHDSSFDLRVLCHKDENA